MLTVIRRIAFIGVCLWLAMSPHNEGTAWAADEIYGPPESVENVVITHIDWAHTLDSATSRAAANDRQVIIEFYTDWCQWCKAMDESTFTNPGVMALSKRVVFARINAEVDTANARTFGIWRYPTCVLTNKGGQEVDRIVGYVPPVAFRQTMQDYLDGKGTPWDLEKRLKTSANDGALLYAIGDKYLERGQFDKARSQMEQVLSRDPNNTAGKTDDAMFAQARMYRLESKWYKAVEVLRRMLTKYPTTDRREEATAYIPWLYAQAGDTTEAVRYYRDFVKDFKNSSENGWAKEQIERLEPSSGAPPAGKTQ